VEPPIVETLEKNPEWIPVDPDVLARAVARVKSKGIPHNPNHLFNKIKLDKIPENFFRGEVKVGRKRHLIFMTEGQIKCLKSTVRLYVDGTFKIIDKPFTLLFSIHGFLKKNGNLKQVPLCCVFMSGRTERDYRKVFEKICDLVGPCDVKEFVSDFEKAIWRVVKMLCRLIRPIRGKNSASFAESTIQFRHYVDSANPIRQIHFFAESTGTQTLLPVGLPCSGVAVM
jgi:hypothetical protein